jgi:FAD binding domain
MQYWLLSGEKARPLIAAIANGGLAIMKGAAEMQALDQEFAPDDATTSGLGRRRFLAAGGGALAGAGALSLARPVHADAATAPLAAGGRYRIYPGDPRYDTMRMGFNRRWVGAPAYIQLVNNAHETVQAVQRALDAHLRITVRGGGHCYENFSSGNYGGVIVDLSNMQGVYMDRPGRICVEGGATMWNVYETLFKNYNLTLPGGSCYSVGVGGHIVGGGYGLLSRQFGLVVDYLTGVDVVCVNRHGQARLVRARQGDPKTEWLLWAHTGGGGGNFGIVTAYYFTGLPNPPEQVQVAITTWLWDQLTQDSLATILRNFGNFMQANSSPRSPYAGLFALIHANHISAGKIAMTTQVAGPAFDLLDTFLAQLNVGMPERALPVTSPKVTLPWLLAPGHRVAGRVRAQPARQVQVLVHEGAIPRGPDRRHLERADRQDLRQSAGAAADRLLRMPGQRRGPERHGRAATVVDHEAAVPDLLGEAPG